MDNVGTAAATAVALPPTVAPAGTTSDGGASGLPGSPGKPRKPTIALKTSSEHAAVASRELLAPRAGTSPRVIRILLVYRLRRPYL